jgi:hypothetical protein
MMDIVDEAKDLIVFVEKNGFPANTNYVLEKLVKEIESLRQQLAKPAVEPLLIALREIAVYEQDTNLLWWQKKAREAIAAYDALQD